MKEKDKKNIKTKMENGKWGKNKKQRKNKGYVPIKQTENAQSYETFLSSCHASF